MTTFLPTEYFCSVCNCCFPYKSKLERHLASEKHKTSVFMNDYSEISGPIIEYGSSGSDIDEIETSSRLDLESEIETDDYNTDGDASNSVSFTVL